MTVCGIKHADGVCVMGECPYIKTCCPAVWDKSGEPMTNEEWFCGLSTEEKAKVMVEVSTRDSLITKRYYEYLLKETTKWLKEKHE